MTGDLYVVATPIGNLQDISFRAIETLNKVDLIAAEDTRITKRLLDKYEISKKTVSFHVKNENFKFKSILELLLDGKNIALVSDAGTPCISDPGYILINQARKNNINVYSIPGATSPIAALSISGLPSERFFFEGFLPKKKGRNKRILELSNIDVTIIFFESPHRLLRTLKDIYSIMGNRYTSICKEISKLNEENYFGRISDVVSSIEKLSSIKGEYVVMVAKEGYGEK